MKWSFLIWHIQYIRYEVYRHVDLSKQDAKVFIYPIKTVVKSILELRAQFSWFFNSFRLFSLIKITLDAPNAFIFMQGHRCKKDAWR